jgi:hypothetical protein
MGREDIQTCQDYNIRLFYSMWRGRGGGREVTLTLLICGGVGEGRGGGNIGGRMWVKVRTEESMRDLVLHHREYTFVATTNRTFLNT